MYQCLSISLCGLAYTFDLSSMNMVLLLRAISTETIPLVMDYVRIYIKKSISSLKVDSVYHSIPEAKAVIASLISHAATKLTSVWWCWTAADQRWKERWWLSGWVAPLDSLYYLYVMVIAKIGRRMDSRRYLNCLDPVIRTHLIHQPTLYYIYSICMHKFEIYTHVVVFLGYSSPFWHFS